MLGAHLSEIEGKPPRAFALSLFPFGFEGLQRGVPSAGTAQTILLTPRGTAHHHLQTLLPIALLVILGRAVFPAAAVVQFLVMVVVVVAAP